MPQPTKFSALNPQEWVGRIEETICKNKQRITTLIKCYAGEERQPQWDDTAQLLDDWDEELMEHLFAPLAHLKSVSETQTLRDAYNQAQPLVTAYITARDQNRQLYGLMVKLRRATRQSLTEAQQKQLDNHLLSCRLRGVNLPPAQGREYNKMLQRLTHLCTKFSENVLDATQAWRKLIKNEAALAGVPAAARQQLSRNAEVAGKEGYLLSLQLPMYLPIIRYADDEALRREVYIAYTTRASDQGPQRGRYDNGPLMPRILALRHKLATMLGYKTSAEMLMVRNMVRAAGEIGDFLQDLAHKALPYAREEVAELTSLVKEHKADFQPWDIDYYSEKLRKRKHDFSAEELRDYFVADRVFAGMFELAEKLFGVHFQRIDEFDAWHKDVTLFAVCRGEEGLGYLYCDLYARVHKCSGAWMDENRQRRRLTDGSLQLPVAYLVCNFSAPLKGQPALLLHDEVLVLFHEFGHCLHHLLTRVECRGVAGIYGVPHDMIELPSQLMENWCWDEKFIAQISSHYRTGAPLTRLHNLLAARNFQSGLRTLRQLGFALFDMNLHTNPRAGDFEKNPALVQRTYAELQRQWNLLPQAEFNRFPTTFSHIFAGGYAAGYYAYMWAEVMAADIYGAFEEKGIYDPALAGRLRKNIFERGGLGDAMENFVAVLGRKPQWDAFLRQRGLAV